MMSDVLEARAQPERRSLRWGLRLGLIYAWLGTIGAEYLFTTTDGIGSMMMDARDLFRMDLVILGMAVIGGVGLVTLFRLAQARSN